MDIPLPSPPVCETLKATPMQPQMSTDPSIILQNPEEWRIEWDEPLDGITPTGETVTRTIHNTMSVQDAIDVARFATLPHQMTEAELLREFLIIHWAWGAHTTYTSRRHPNGDSQ